MVCVRIAAGHVELDHTTRLLPAQPQPLPSVLPALYALDPAGIVEIPLHRPPQPRSEIVFGLPA